MDKIYLSYQYYLLVHSLKFRLTAIVPYEVFSFREQHPQWLHLLCSVFMPTLYGTIVFATVCTGKQLVED